MHVAGTPAADGLGHRGHPADGRRPAFAASPSASSRTLGGTALRGVRFPRPAAADRPAGDRGPTRIGRGAGPGGPGPARRAARPAAG